MNSENALINFMARLTPQLGHYYGLAYRYCYEDPENSLVKLRVCASLLLALVCRHYDLPIHGSLWEQLQNEKLQTLIPPYILDRFNRLRVEGNRGAHPLEQVRAPIVAKKIALLTLEFTYQIAYWYCESLLGQSAQTIPLFQPPNPANSDRIYKDAIITEQAEAQYAIGLMFCQKIESVSTNLSETESPRQIWQQDAYYWLKKSADQNYPPALYQLGQLHLNSRGHLRNLKQAIALLKQAAELDYADALHQMGLFYFYGRLNEQVQYEHDYCQSLRYFTKAALQDHPGALNYLVQMYYEGLGVKQNVQKAFRYAQKAAEAGYASAQFKLAYLYQSGLGTPADEKLAFYWYQCAAQNGDADAQVVLFKYYSSGLWVEKNIHIALEWLHLAEAQHHAGACYYLALAYQRGIGVAVDMRRAALLFQRCLQFDEEKQYQTAAVELARIIHDNKNIVQALKIGRNQCCPCGSGLKYKKCCGENTG
ncbi:SEC-C metal-binding domain-containing protein [Thioflexithrix psekupsensis]|uniref:DUF4145 domain-containing protein n=1 Tax=Thioflexithrix psekupsensis TaxID=1570016 RepID=A0A251X9H6_9GAMM|nr:SEC-C metal-binding domain-containing protein [Thioflexithrix psekupsensis]OUD14621.1 hypothetical protein TPSD3_10090 [Thioflexithrix psekupsensis]